MAVLAETVRRLRAEVAATTEPSRQARLLTEIGDAQERAGDEPAATRDYLAAYSADPTFREPLEGLVRLLEKRRSLKNLGRLVDALVSASTGPDERVRSLLMRAAYQADVAGQVPEAQDTARDATAIEDAPAPERASAWLALEVLAGRTGDSATRDAALHERVRYSADPTWRGLLLVDLARLRATRGEIDSALALLQETRSIESQATWAATTQLLLLLRDHPGIAETEESRGRAALRADALEATATLVDDATGDAAKGDAAGVPLWVRRPARVVDAWVRAAESRRQLGQLDRAAKMLDRAVAAAGSDPASEDERRLAEGIVASERIRIAEQLGDTGQAASVAEKLLASETDAGLRAALALRVAEHAGSQGNAAAALEALSRAIESDPACLPARALQLDLLADGADQAAFAAQLETFAEHLGTDEARGRSFLLAAYVWAVRAGDPAGAKAALSQAAMFGASPTTVGRLARTLASVTGDAAWYEDATKRLLAAGASDREASEATSLYVELFRLRAARGDVDGAAKALREMGAVPRGAWLARVLEAFLPTPAGTDSGDRARTAAEELASLEADPELSRGLSLVAAIRSQARGDVSSARKRLHELADRDPSEAIVAAYLSDLDRAAGDHAAAARVASDAATASTDGERAAALRLEAAFERWREGDRVAAIEEMEAALAGAPEAARLALGWASWGVDPDSIDGRRRAIERAEHGDGVGDPRRLALERFALELGGTDPEAARMAMAGLEMSPGAGSLGVAAALGRLVWPEGASDGAALRDAITRIGERGPQARLMAAIEHVRMAREANDPEELAKHACRWFEAGGGLPAALEWLAATSALGRPREEHPARVAIAESLAGDEREALLASAALLQAAADPDAPTPLVGGGSTAVRLANLELAPPGCDPRRRAVALADIGDTLGEDAELDAIALSGWASLAASDVDGARHAFERAAAARPGDLAPWEGLRACAKLSGDTVLRVRAASELGARCQDAHRGAAFWEEAALLCLEIGDEATADVALLACFDRDPTRSVAFDKLFRRVRARKDNQLLLTLMQRRLEFTDDPSEIQKLFWEQARVLRENGDQDGSLKALEHVTMLDPDHVGALALLGEINIRRGNFEDAATALGRLAALDTAPPKNRVTAGVAAVDLYENKLGRFDRALEVLLTLHRAKLSNLPVRERLARAAARTGTWSEATAILEELMLERPEAEGRIEAARLAMAIHRDRLGKPDAAAAAIVKLLEEAPGDGEAIDMLLQTTHPSDVLERLLGAARTALGRAVANQPTDTTTIRRLARVARSLRDDPLQQAALGALACLGAGDTQSDSTFAQLAAKNARAPQVSVSGSMMKTILAPGDSGPIADLFVLLGPTLAESLGPTLAACGVGRRDKVDPRSGIALRHEIAAWAGALGIHQFDLYVGGNDPLAVQGVPGETMSLVVGASVNAPLAPATRGRVARELLAMVRGTTIVRSRDDTTIAAIVIAASRLGEVRVDHPAYAILPEIERQIGKEIPRKTRKALPDVCRAIAEQRADAREWSKRAVASHDRIFALASGDPSVVLADALGVPADRLGKSVLGDARAEELLRFVLSREYLELRRQLGLEGRA
jgi:tetratricopeptide (TPR) repeat protein